jgi:hypothetical protein
VAIVWKGGFPSARPARKTSLFGKPTFGGSTETKKARSVVALSRDPPQRRGSPVRLRLPVYLRRFTGLLSGSPPTDTRPQARAIWAGRNIGKKSGGTRGFGTARPNSRILLLIGTRSDLERGMDRKAAAFAARCAMPFRASRSGTLSVIAAIASARAAVRFMLGWRCRVRLPPDAQRVADESASGSGRRIKRDAAAVCRRRRLLHNDLRSDLHAVVEVDHVDVAHTDAA